MSAAAAAAILDPDPDSEYGSGSTDPIEYGFNTDPDPDPQPRFHSLFFFKTRKIQKIEVVVMERKEYFFLISSWIEIVHENAERCGN